MSSMVASTAIRVPTSPGSGRHFFLFMRRSDGREGMFLLDCDGGKRMLQLKC